jgi:hypothetical protein
VSYAVIRDNVADFPIRIMCEVLGVSRSGYYAWAQRAESARAGSDRILGAEIRTVQAASHGRYGSPCVHAELRSRGRRVGRKLIARLMRGMGLSARRKRRFRRTTDSTHAFPVAPNLLQRNFKAVGPDRIWLADLTYVWTDDGWLYLAAVLDLFTRRIVGWAELPKVLPAQRVEWQRRAWLITLAMSWRWQRSIWRSRPATGGRPGENTGGRPERSDRRFRIDIATSS